MTASFYRDAGIVCAGIQPVADGALRPYEILEVNGIRCAIFSLTQSTNGHALPEDAPYVLHTLDDPEAVQEAIAAGEADADCSIVFVHWGTEYAAEPDEAQRLWAQRFADWGVEVVIGTHPHVLQPVEWVTGVDGHETLVYYSLGISFRHRPKRRAAWAVWPGLPSPSRGRTAPYPTMGLTRYRPGRKTGGTPRPWRRIHDF